MAHEINTLLGAIYSNNDSVSRSVSKMKSILQSWDNSHKEPQYPKFLRLVEGIEATGEVNRTDTRWLYLHGICVICMSLAVRGILETEIHSQNIRGQPEPVDKLGSDEKS